MGDSRIDTNRVHGVDAFSALIALPLYPVPVKIGEQTVDVVSASRVAIPFPGVVPQQSFVLQRVRFLKVAQALGSMDPT